MEEPEDPGEPPTRPAAVLQRRGTSPTVPTVKSVLLRARAWSSQSLGTPRPEERCPPAPCFPLISDHQLALLLLQFQPAPALRKMPPLPLERAASGPSWPGSNAEARQVTRHKGGLFLCQSSSVISGQDISCRGLWGDGESCAHGRAPASAWRPPQPQGARPTAQSWARGAAFLLMVNVHSYFSGSRLSHICSGQISRHRAGRQREQPGPRVQRPGGQAFLL